ncbi:hypothetical protein GQ55_9G495800 [Panicum hallii var. hallii]|uniref:Uncharacterized protein n=1 Tax=Panicum hallii var. hallii TaxID=1504633 RepID=A0A2T7CDB4_9POAL|nr:hypothetical protein GQ55_9G495800 [Panicum hallii var. hallii]
MPPRTTGPRRDGHPPSSPVPPGPRIRRRRRRQSRWQVPCRPVGTAASEQSRGSGATAAAAREQTGAGAERTSCRALPSTEKRTRRLSTASACSLRKDLRAASCSCRGSW